MNRKIFVFFVIGFSAFALGGCGLKTASSDVMRLGPDTYTVMADDYRPSNAKNEALSKASQYCADRKQEILVKSTNERGSNTGRHYFDVTFRCLNQNDRELVRPEFKRSPDVVIEDRTR